MIIKYTNVLVNFIFVQQIRTSFFHDKKLVTKNVQQKKNHLSEFYLTNYIYKKCEINTMKEAKKKKINIDIKKKLSNYELEKFIEHVEK